MPAAKQKSWISLQFNDYDFRHRKVPEVLRARPRNMTDLVVNAILHFISCPDAEQGYDRETIRKLIRDVIQEMLADGSISLPASGQKAAEPAADPDLGDMMAMFRGGD